MEYTTLGNTGLRISVAGLGCGGHSRLGLAHGKSKVEAVALVQQAIGLGVNFIDTVLFGTSNPDHLEANIASLLRPPLPKEDVRRLKQLFARLDNVSGN